MLRGGRRIVPPVVLLPTLDHPVCFRHKRVAGNPRGCPGTAALAEELLSYLAPLLMIHTFLERPRTLQCLRITRQEHRLQERHPARDFELAHAGVPEEAQSALCLAQGQNLISLMCWSGI